MTPDNTPHAPILRYFASCPSGVADLLATELRQLGAERIHEQRAGVMFEGSLETGYRACLWSRTASRILLQLAEVDARDAEELYRGIQSIDWSRHLGAGRTLAVDFGGTNSQITHTRFAALKVKDAIVDQLRARRGERPSVNVDQPDVRIAVRLNRGRAAVGIDLSGDPLHRRGYRIRPVSAPLKENLAAAILLRSGWPAIAAAGGGLVDPMCGSGTFLIEAAMLAADQAPGLHRVYYGFIGWAGHDAALWQTLLEEARQRRNSAAVIAGSIQGWDDDPAAVSAARANVSEARFGPLIRVERRALGEWIDDDPAGPALPAAGLLVTNPPYGERLGEAERLEPLYARLGQLLRQRFVGWRAVVFTGNPPLARAIGIHAKRSHTFFNGAIECRLLRFEVSPESFDDPGKRPSREEKLAAIRETPGAQMFGNRLRKNLKKFSDWAKKEGIGSYRVYDADMPEYAFAIDWYAGDGEEAATVYVQEYTAPGTVDRTAARQRRLEVLSVIPAVFGIGDAQVVVRNRLPSTDAGPWGATVDESLARVVAEGPWRFLVNFSDDTDPGFSPNHRLTRHMIGTLAAGKRVLNLFAHTGTATVYAAGGGAESTTSVDSSSTNLGRAERNLALNRLSGHNHVFIHADVLLWLREASSKQRRPRYDLIIVDAPPTVRGRRADESFEVQRDHVRLLVDVSRLLSTEGTIVFSTRHAKFRLDREGLHDFRIEEVSRQTLPKDFERSPRSHSVFLLQYAGAADTPWSPRPGSPDQFKETSHG